MPEENSKGLSGKKRKFSTRKGNSHAEAKVFCENKNLWICEEEKSLGGLAVTPKPQKSVTVHKHLFKLEKTAFVCTCVQKTVLPMAF